MRPYPIVVGADGTDSSKKAVRWAAHEAQRRGLPLRVTHVFDWEWREARFDTSHGYLDLAREQAESITAGAEFEARVVARSLEIEGDPVIGHAGARLLQESEQAELMVLGSRGRGGFASLLLGSVSQRVATHARCPVVVVRGRGDATEGPVAVGVDDSPAADLVLETAFEAAAARGAALRVIRSYLPVIPLWLENVRAADVETPAADAEERANLDEQLAPWRAKYPEVPVDVVLTHDSAAAALVEASAQAQLVMVGSRGHGVIAGSLLGSAGLQLLQHAECPVYIVRPVARKS
ncbi:universal stress protein [Paractinoplanes rishiriensis]|uniref:Universal stress protein n=1 Tax=Paractinoplanes rishiriensis TaxID=1050105 RepID=A0A919N2T1_9ACTN|nr:universal stress protein [Actinoplanes rishiriensis]GIF01753.1 universal stress protein [Actinoplanes rishiriensis]